MRYRAVATVAASAEFVAARSWGALPNRIKPLDGDTCTLDLSGDSLPRIAALLTGLDIDYTLDADPAVFDHLATVADRMHRAERPPT